MKTCKTCNQSLHESNFYARPDRKNKHHSYCKNCFNEYCKKRWTLRKQEAIELKGGKCQICGYSKCPAALEFHHTNPKEKDFDWNKMRLRSWESIINELAKCVLVCSNCHREIHYTIYDDSLPKH